MFQTPTTMTISGTTGSGKSTWLYKLLKYRNDMFSTPPKNILMCYGSVWQPLFDKMEKELNTIEFHKGVPSESFITEFANPEEHKIVILDDLMGEIANDVNVQSLFTKGSHHLNLTVIWLSQNLFSQGKIMRTISINTHYIVLLHNPRVQQIKTLGSQLGIGKSIMEAYTDCMKTKYGYLVVDLCPHKTDDYIMKTNIFPEEDTIVYIPI